MICQWRTDHDLFVDADQLFVERLTNHDILREPSSIKQLDVASPPIYYS